MSEVIKKVQAILRSAERRHLNEASVNLHIAGMTRKFSEQEIWDALPNAEKLKFRTWIKNVDTANVWCEDLENSIRGIDKFKNFFAQM